MWMSIAGKPEGVTDLNVTKYCEKGQMKSDLLQDAS